MKYKLLLLVSIFSLVTSAAANAESIESALAKCSEQGNSLQRLVCYDKVVKDLDQYQGLDTSLTRARVKAQADEVPSKAPNANVAAQPSSTPEEDTDFGMEHKQDVSDKADSMTARVTALRETVTGKVVIGLSNGTVWQQTDSNKLKIKKNQSVTIERGWLGAFYLSKEGLNTRLKVKRIK